MAKIGDIPKAILYMLKADSLTNSNASKIFIKSSLADLSFKDEDYINTIKYYYEAITCGANFKNDLFINTAYPCCMNSYIRIGNLDKAKIMLQTAHKYFIQSSLKVKEWMLDSLAAKNADENYASTALKKQIESENLSEFKMLLTFITDENASNKPIFLIGGYMLSLINNSEASDNIYGENEFIGRQFPIFQIARSLMEGNYLQFFKYVEPLHPDNNNVPYSSFEFEHIAGDVIFQHAKKFVDNRRADSLKAYGEYLKKIAPSFYYGNALLGYYYKLSNQHTKAEELFSTALALAENTRISTKEIVIQEILDMKSRR